MRALLTIATMLALAAAVAAAAPTPAPLPVEAYGALPSVDLVSVSPDGSKLALVVGDETTRQIQIRRLEDNSPLQVLGIGRAKVRGLRWAGENHLLVTASQTAKLGGLTGPKREYFLVTDFNLLTRKMSTLLGSHVDEVAKLNAVVDDPVTAIIDGKPVAFVEGLSFPGERGVVTLFRVDLDSGKTRVVLTGNLNTRDFLVDQSGSVVAGYDLDEAAGTASIWTRAPNGSTQWLKSIKGATDVELKGFGRDAGTVLVAVSDDTHEDFHPLPLGGTTLDPALATMRDGEPVLDPATGRTIGSVRDDGQVVRYSFLAPADAALWAKVLRAFPKAVVRLAAWSDDRLQIVLRVEGKGFGAAYYWLDTEAYRAAPLADEYAGITGQDLAEQTTIQYPVGDGLAIPAFLTLPQGRPAKGLPLVVLPHGGPAAHDDAGFDWWAQALASRGYAVLQPQFRGSTGFGEKFYAAGLGEWGRKMQSDLSDGVAFLAAQGTIDPSRVCIVGASYGGYAALAGVTLQHGIYRCAVSLAGPADLRAMLGYEVTTHGGTANQGMRFWQRFMGVTSQIDPSLDARSPLRLAARVDVPILLIHGIDDTVVPFSQSKAMASALAKAKHPAQLVALPGEDHWLSRGETRTTMLRATVKFLAANLPVDPVSPDSGKGGTIGSE